MLRTGRRRAFWIASACAFLLSACASKPPPEGAQLATRGDPSLDPAARRNTVNFLDPSLDGRLSVERINSRRTPTGTLEVVAVVRNRTADSMQIEGRIQFFGADDLAIEKATAWQRVFLPPNGVGTYQDSSTSTEGIAYYYVEMREGQ